MVKSEVLAALSRSCHQLAEHLESFPDPDVQVPGMAWTVGALGAHLVTNMVELTLALRGRPCAYDKAFEAGTMGNVDDDLVAHYSERDPKVLSRRLLSELEEFSAALSARGGDEGVPVIAPNATTNAIGAIFVLDQNNHGSQLAGAGGPSWDLNLADVQLGVVTLVPAIIDRDVVKSFEGKFALCLRGTTDIGITVDHGTFEIDGPRGRVDCHIVADPIAFLRMNAGGFITPRRAVLTGKLFAYGLKPWKMLGFSRLMQPVTHGGKQP